MKVTRFNLPKLNNSELVHYGTEAKKLILECNLTEVEMKVVEEFLAALDEFIKIQTTEQESFTPLLQEADASTDRAWMAINNTLIMNLDHYDEDVKQAAIFVKGVFDKVPNPTRLKYQAEYAELTKLFERMDVVPDHVMKKSGVDGWYEELRRRANDFDNLRASQLTTKKSVEAGASKKVRTTLVEAHRAMIEKINAFMLFCPTVNMKGFAEGFENLNNRMRTSQKAEDTKEEKDKAKKEAANAPE